MFIMTLYIYLAEKTQRTYGIHMIHQVGSIYGVGDVQFASRPTTAILRKSKTAEILTTEKSRDRNPV